MRQGCGLNGCGSLALIACVCMALVGCGGGESDSAANTMDDTRGQTPAGATTGGATATGGTGAASVAEDSPGVSPHLRDARQWAAMGEPWSMAFVRYLNSTQDSGEQIAEALVSVMKADKHGLGPGAGLLYEKRSGEYGDKLAPAFDPVMRLIEQAHPEGVSELVLTHRPSRHLPQPALASAFDAYSSQAIRDALSAGSPLAHEKAVHGVYSGGPYVPWQKTLEAASEYIRDPQMFEALLKFAQQQHEAGATQPFAAALKALNRFSATVTESAGKKDDPFAPHKLDLDTVMQWSQDPSVQLPSRIDLHEMAKFIAKSDLSVELAGKQYTAKRYAGLAGAFEDGAVYVGIAGRNVYPGVSPSSRPNPQPPFTVVFITEEDGAVAQVTVVTAKDQVAKWANSRAVVYLVLGGGQSESFEVGQKLDIDLAKLKLLAG